MLKADILILGGGLAGLSTAYHLRKLGRGADCMILEKNARAGGLAGTLEKDGFLFDHTGHLLHLHDPYGKALILKLLQGNWKLHQRSSWIYSHRVFTRYPFQANTYGLPKKVVRECVVGFLKTLRGKTGHGARLTSGKEPSFKDWCLEMFGAGISKRFMFPYNEKLWRLPLDRMTTEWQGRFVPKPNVEEVLYGALMDQKKHFGYNATFRYPLRGGIQVLPDALAGQVQNLCLNALVTKVDLKNRVVVAGSLGEISYQRLVNTLPLPHLLDLVEYLPEPVREARRLLRWNSVYCFNLGIGRPHISDKHWVYFPEKRFVFYRAGFSSNFSPYVAPKGSTAMYIEVSRKPGERLDAAVTQNAVLAGLRSCGLLKSSDRLWTSLLVRIPCAYVVYDFNRTRAVKTIFDFLRSHGVESIGRYGAWKYSFMEETILDGKMCAERLLGFKTRSPALPQSQQELKALK